MYSAGHCDAKAVLSGIEIAEAIARHKKYLVCCQDLKTSSPLYNHYHSLLGEKMLQLQPLPRIAIDDFPLGCKLNPNSYNLRLHDELQVYGENVPASVLRDLYVKHPPELDMRAAAKTTTFKIPPEGMILYPGVLYLGRTVERTESYNVVPCIEGRSSIGRLGMSVHVTAGYGDVGFTGTWTLEITVVQPLRVYAGVQVCQIGFQTISSRHIAYNSDKYQNQVGIVPSRLHVELNKEHNDGKPSNQSGDEPA